MKTCINIILTSIYSCLCWICFPTDLRKVSIYADYPYIKCKLVLFIGCDLWQVIDRYLQRKPKFCISEFTTPVMTDGSSRDIIAPNNFHYKDVYTETCMPGILGLWRARFSLLLALFHCLTIWLVEALILKNSKSLLNVLV